MKNVEITTRTNIDMRIRRIIDLFKFIITFQIIFEIIKLKRIIKNIKSSFDIKRSIEGNELVSIVVPTKNEANFLPILFKSLENSWYKPLEVIIVDYLSHDDTIKIAENFGAKVINADKKGVGYASHLGVLNSNGNIIIRTDADAVFPPDLIFNTVKLLKKDSTLKLHHIGHLYYDGNIIENLIAILYDTYWREIYKTTGQFIAFKKDVYESVGGFKPNKIIGEDFDFGGRFFGRYNISYNPNQIILVSSRRIKRTGFINYVLGKRRWN